MIASAEKLQMENPALRHPNKSKRDEFAVGSRWRMCTPGRGCPRKQGTVGYPDCQATKQPTAPAMARTNYALPKKVDMPADGIHCVPKEGRVVAVVQLCLVKFGAWQIRAGPLISNTKCSNQVEQAEMGCGVKHSLATPFIDGLKIIQVNLSRRPGLAASKEWVGSPTSTCPSLTYR